ncbi:hypothetical protein PV327_001980 [Microctonus hyperodae]|uniref:Bee-milk protein n=1 Tax=Microctonus hyperodae TaxID=165561 RepID=A0AA39FEM1_MICHY|nr:hypothetical protein PV327_001980 [Microctonus hyperodae]
MKIISLLFIFSFTVVCHGQNPDLVETLYEWKYIEYEWESDAQKQSAISSGDYEMSASVPIDVDIFESRVFVTIMRTKGVPATLGVVTSESGDGGPIIRPYPNWEMNQAKDCKGILSIDSCNQMWILDSGMVDDEYKCPAKLVGVDMVNDTIISNMEIERDLYKGTLANIVVYHTKDSCTYPTILMSDANGGALVIYDGKGFCRFESTYFQSFYGDETYTIDGESITQPFIIQALAISYRTNHQLEEGQPILNFRTLPSNRIHWMLMNSLSSYCDTKTPPQTFQTIYKISTQSVGFAIANKILFYGDINSTSLYCYNTMKYLSSKTNVMLVQDNERFQWISGIKSYPKTIDWAQSIIMLSNRYQKVVAKTINNDEVNFRILSAIADDLAFKTNCF